MAKKKQDLNKQGFLADVGDAVVSGLAACKKIIRHHPVEGPLRMAAGALALLPVLAALGCTVAFVGGIGLSAIGVMPAYALAGPFVGAGLFSFMGIATMAMVEDTAGWLRERHSAIVWDEMYNPAARRPADTGNGPGKVAGLSLAKTFAARAARGLGLGKKTAAPAQKPASPGA